MIRNLTNECSRKGLGDFSVTRIVGGYWNKVDGSDIEIDMVAVDETNRRVRFGSCKRRADAHDRASIEGFKDHVRRFMATKIGLPMIDWRIEFVAYAPRFSPEQRSRIVAQGCLAIDLGDFRALISRAA